MFTFCECLYQAWLFTSPEQTRYDLKYVCLEKDAIYGVSGSRLYQGFPDDNPWESFTPDKLGRIFLKPQEKPSLKGDGRLDIKGKIVALGTEWKISNSVPFPPTKKILEIYTPEQFFPVDKREWERMIRFRSIFADPVCKISIYMIEQDRGNLIATPVPTENVPKKALPPYLLSGGANQHHYAITANLNLWPCRMKAPDGVALQREALIATWPQARVIILGLKPEDKIKILGEKTALNRK